MEKSLDVTSVGSRNNGRIDGSCKYLISEEWKERWMVQAMDQGARNGTMDDAGLDQGTIDSYFM